MLRESVNLSVELTQITGKLKGSFGKFSPQAKQNRGRREAEKHKKSSMFPGGKRLLRGLFAAPYLLPKNTKNCLV